MRRPGRQTSLACETKSDGKRINALDAPLNSTPPRRPKGPRNDRALFRVIERGRMQR